MVVTVLTMKSSRAAECLAHSDQIKYLVDDVAVVKKWGAHFMSISS